MSQEATSASYRVSVHRVLFRLAIDPRLRRIFNPSRSSRNRKV